ncbi:MAG TPA: polysaccharide biosynthesis/export family protein [Chitinophagaceae bacterium]|jgi:polysaccharide export outer membrane protein|nr:polysaccharide biosynthesis/export family protein [Chitinophagaceae bacterium]
MKSNIKLKIPVRKDILFPASLICILFCSCVTDKKTTYFKDIPDSLYLAARNIRTAAFHEPVVRPGDIMQISILTLDPQANNILTTSNSASYTVQPANSGNAAGAAPITGYLVDTKGLIELPIVGKINILGLTSTAVKDLVHEKVSRYYNNPVVSVRYANFSVTILGEVAKPATYVVPNEKISILDAIGMAGDLTIFGKRENILLIRDSSGQKQSVRFDLNSSAMFSSPYFYLRQGDMIYVEPSKSKVAATDTNRNRNVTLIASGLTLLIVLFSRL